MNYIAEIINSCSYADNSASIRIHGPKGGAVPWRAGTRASGSALPTIARGWRKDRAAQIPARTADRLSAAHPGQARRPDRQGRGDQAERLRTVERLAAAKKGTGFAKAGLRQAEYRLTLLGGWPALDRGRATG